MMVNDMVNDGFSDVSWWLMIWLMMVSDMVNDG